jgi:hypothetical protein
MRDALIETTAFITALLACRDDEAIDLLMSAGEDVEARALEAIGEGQNRARL